MRFRFSALYRACVGFALVGGTMLRAQPSAAQIEEVLAQNRRLQEQVLQQQKTIEDLAAKMREVERASERHERELRVLVGPAGGSEAAPALERPAGFARGAAEVRVAAEVGLAYFHTGRNGQFPNGEFRADDPTLTVEAPVMKDVYFFTELKLLPREANEETFELGEIYVDFENVLGRFGHDGLLNLRVGRLNIPFGEEYLVRSPVTNPLISHSLADFWGVDEGVEVYGRIGPAHYVLAVQNGGVSRLRDFHRDKAITARIGWQPRPWLHVSGSVLRTGKLTAAGDNLSELWFGNAFFRALGASATTETFWASAYQADARARWRRGHAAASLGVVHFDDSDTRADNSRRLRYGYFEVVQDLIENLYGAARLSEIDAPRGYPIAGWGSMGAYFFRPGVLTEELRRLSVGIGYRFGAPLILKIEYAWERGRLTTGVRREHGDFFGTELAVKF